MTERKTEDMIEAKVSYLNSISKGKYETYHAYNQVAIVNKDTRDYITRQGTKTEVYYELDAITSWLRNEELEARKPRDIKV